MSFLLLFCLSQWVFGLLKKLERAYKKKQLKGITNNQPWVHVPHEDFLLDPSLNDSMKYAIYQLKS